MVTPAIHDFGQVDIPCTDTVDVLLTSIGDDPVTITDIEYTSGGTLGIDPSWLTLPLTLEPGKTAVLPVQVDTTLPGTDFGALTITSDDPEGVDTAEQTVEVAAQSVEEEFTEPGIPPVDILFLIDQSCSMAALAEDNIRNGMPAFVNELQSVADWQLIQVTKSEGCSNGGIMDATTSNAAQLLSDNAFNVLFDGLYSEQLLKHAEKALSLTDAGECNEGFLRQGASLHILIASDEPEQSFQPWNHWVGEYETYVTHPDLVTVSGILNLTSDDACSDFNGGGPDGYIDAVLATGGVALDICQAGWGSQLTDIATATVAGMRVYNLSQNAVDGTVQVLVNGVEPTDWEFVDATNSVRIREPLIDEGDVVSVTYSVLAECST